MTSFAHFSFFRHIRNSARPPFPVPRLLRSWCASSAASSYTAGTTTIPSRAPTPSLFSTSVVGRDSFQRDITSPISISGEGKERERMEQGVINNNNVSSGPMSTPALPFPSSTSAGARTPFFLSPSSSWSDYLAETAYFENVTRRANLNSISMRRQRDGVRISHAEHATQAIPGWRPASRLPIAVMHDAAAQSR